MDVEEPLHGCPFQCGFTTPSAAALIRHGRDECPRRPREPFMAQDDEDEARAAADAYERDRWKDWSE